MRSTTVRVLVVVILIGVLARIVWQIRSGFYVHPETWEYDDVARNIVTGHGYFSSASPPSGARDGGSASSSSCCSW